MADIVISTCFGGFGLSEQAQQWLQSRGFQPDPEYGWHSSFENRRHDPLLVECVRVLGKAANGRCARLEIADIDARFYRIENYDGQESVNERSVHGWVDTESK